MLFILQRVPLILSLVLFPSPTFFFLFAFIYLEMTICSEAKKSVPVDQVQCSVPAANCLIKAWWKGLVLAINTVHISVVLIRF